MKFVEECTHCYRPVDVTVEPAHIPYPVLQFVCYYCDRTFKVDHICRLAWKNDPYSGMYYLTFISKYQEPDESYRVFDFYKTC